MGSLKSPVPQVQDLEPCKFPQLNKAFVAPDERLLARVDISSESRIALHDFCKNQDVELEAVIQAAWALTLHSYLGSDTTLFGYGNLTICGDRFDAAHTILQHLKRIAQSDYATSSVSWHSVKGSDVGADLFNTELFITSDRQSSDDTERENASKMVRFKNSVQIGYTVPELIVSSLTWFFCILLKRKYRRFKLSIICHFSMRLRGNVLQGQFVIF